MTILVEFLFFCLLLVVYLFLQNDMGSDKNAGPCRSCGVYMNVTQCENCHKDKLDVSLKNKEWKTRNSGVLLKQRSIIDRPDKTELEDLSKEVEKNDDICDGVDKISRLLNVKADTSALRQSNQELNRYIEKWKRFEEREQAIDESIEHIRNDIDVLILR
jgi:hypothetical protein